MDIQKNRIRRCIAAIFLFTSSALLWAQAPIEKEQKIFRVHISQTGEEQLVEVEAPVPGAEYEYELIYRNVSGENLDGIVVRQPVYAKGTYLWGSAVAPEGVEFNISLDNGVTFLPESSLEMEQEEARSAVKVKAGKSFQALQWVFRRPMKADEITRVTYRVLVE